MSEVKKCDQCVEAIYLVWRHEKVETDEGEKEINTLIEIYRKLDTAWDVYVKLNEEAEQDKFYSIEKRKVVGE